MTLKYNIKMKHMLHRIMMVVLCVVLYKIKQNKNNVKFIQVIMKNLIYIYSHVALPARTAVNLHQCKLAMYGFDSPLTFRATCFGRPLKETLVLKR